MYQFSFTVQLYILVHGNCHDCLSWGVNYHISLSMPCSFSWCFVMIVCHEASIIIFCLVCHAAFHDHAIVGKSKHLYGDHTGLETSKLHFFAIGSICFLFDLTKVNVFFFSSRYRSHQNEQYEMSILYDPSWVWTKRIFFWSNSFSITRIYTILYYKYYYTIYIFV